MTATGEASDEAACFMLNREMRGCRVVARFTIDGEPASKARARFTRQGSKVRSYTPEKTRAAEETIAWAFRKEAPTHRLNPDISYGVMAIFFADTRQRRDVDNMLKLVLDGLNKVAWPDDSQVEEVSGRRGYDIDGNARTEILVYEVSRIRRPSRPCQQCGTEFLDYRSTASRKYCSLACAYEARRARRQKVCAYCGAEFESVKIEQPAKYCSRECSDAARRAEVACGYCGKTFTIQRCHKRATNYCSDECRDAGFRERRRSIPKGTCQTCGGPVSRREYVQCRACRVKGTAIKGAPVVSSVDTEGGAE